MQAVSPRGSSFAGMRVTVIGLGIEGQDLVQYFAARGAIVTVSDAKPEKTLERQLEAIAGLPVRLSLGENRAEVVDGADLVAVSQGAPLSLPPIARAIAGGIPLTSRTQLFLERCPGIVVGISGSSGKTTTTSLVGSIFAMSGRNYVVGGNIGGPLLSRLDGIDEDTWVILEVSHTQLTMTRQSPHIACLTNVTPNHLDHFTWDEYVGLKRHLIAYQTSDDRVILNLDNEITRGFGADARARPFYFSTRGEIPGDGAFLRGGQIFWREAGIESEVLPVTSIPLRGHHNVENAVCATAVAGACGIPAEVIAKAICGFQAVPHRLELVREVNGVSYFNDSIATTPERTLAGLRSFEQPVVLLLGGRDKHLPLEELATEAATRCRAVVCFGEAADLLARACRAAHPNGTCDPFIRSVPGLREAVELASTLAQAGDVVLLSPACTSFDAYDNFEERGIEFRALVQWRPTAAGAREGKTGLEAEA
jgi:UDP-N-acetylmuramoylalanine--D-glutamate ligase